MPEQVLRDAVTSIQTSVYAARRQRGWSQKDLAEKIGRNNAQVSRALTGAMTEDAVKTREAIYKILDIDEKVNGEDERG